MGRVFTVTNSDSLNPNIRKKTIGREIIIGPNAIKFIAIAIFAILALIYLAQSTAGANRSIKIQEQNDQKNNLNLERERYEVEETRLKSLKEIESGIEKNSMEPPGDVEIISN